MASRSASSCCSSGHSGGRDDATRTCVRPPAVGAGLAGPVTDDATRTCVRPPAVGAGLAGHVTDDATRTCVGPPTEDAGPAALDTMTPPGLPLIPWSPFVGAPLIMFTSRHRPLA